MRKIKQIFIFGLSFLIVLCFCEIFIRTAHISSVSPTEFYEDIGRGRRKDLNYLYFNEGFGIGKFNRLRYLGEANPATKPKNTIRIALLGDSYTESFQVFDRHYFGNIAENILSEKFPETRFELLNFGRSGFDIGDMYAYHKFFVENFNSDYIIYMISNGDLEPKYSDILRPKTLIKGDSLIISKDYDNSRIKSFQKTKLLTQNFSIMHMLNTGRKKIKTTPIESILLGKIYTWFVPNTKKENDSSNSIDKELNPVTIEIVKNLNPSKVIFINRGIQPITNNYFNTLVINNFAYLDLSKPLNEMIQTGVDPYEWEVTGKVGHWNHKAHQVIGAEIANQISEIIEVENN